MGKFSRVYITKLVIKKLGLTKQLSLEVGHNRGTTVVNMVVECC